MVRDGYRILVLVLVACAARAAPRVTPAGDALLLRGCYACLREARDDYRRRGDATRVFDADLLIAVREKELALPPSDALGEARRLAVPDAAHYLALVEAIPTEQLGIPRRTTRAFAAAHEGFRARIHAEQQWLAASALRLPVREYLRLALACAYFEAPPAAPAIAAPLLAYRDQICDVMNAGALKAVRASEPRFVEAGFFLAYTGLVGADGDAALAAHVAEVVAQLPASTAVRYLAASYARSIGDDAQALAHYDRLLAAQPAHEQAVLGRVVCLSHLRRTDEAIAAATQLIGLDAELGEAYYWRAWNHHARGELPAARADIELAKQELDESWVRSLAGVIAYDQHDLDPAQADLEAALAGAPGDCVARSYLASVHRARKRWAIAAAGFAHARRCYSDRAAATEARIAALTDERSRARLRDDVSRDTAQARRSALAGAACLEAAGDRAAAGALLDGVGDDPSLAADVARLRARLDAPKPSDRSDRRR